MNIAAKAVIVISARYNVPSARWKGLPLVEKKINHVPRKKAGTTVAR